MPRPNPGRTLFAEQHLADRIAIEREARGLTYEQLAQRMADVGCPIQPSAIYKIEKAEPRRRITVDELLAFSQVFGATMASLVSDPARTLPDRIAEAHERLLLQEAAARTLHTLASQAEEALTRLAEEANALFAQLPAGTERPVIEAMIGTEEEIAERQRRLDAAAAPQRTKRGKR